MSRVDKKNVFWKKVGDETVVLNIDTGFYYTLGDVGGRMWEMLTADENEELIVSKIASLYGVPKKRVAQDLEELIQDLKKERLLSANKK